MSQTAIPFVFMRGGTSRGPYFRREDLPKDRYQLGKVLVAAVGSGHPLNIDGIGGGAAVTTKVAMLSESPDDWADVDYFFAQVSVEDGLVDYRPTCGNILAGVGPAAIEMGLAKASEGTTEVRVRAVNTGARIRCKVRTSGGSPVYVGGTVIDGVPGTAAPIDLTFLDAVGSSTGSMFPTGKPRDFMQGFEVTCMDVAMPVVIARATDFGLIGYESAIELDADCKFFERMEAVRREAGERMGLGDVTQSVVPKFAVMAPPHGDGSFAARYFMPWKTHPTMAVTGAQCLASCALAPDTVAEGLVSLPAGSPSTVSIEHPSGNLDVLVEYTTENGFTLVAAGLVRTARKLAQGSVFVPESVWDGGRPKERDDG